MASPSVRRSRDRIYLSRIVDRASASFSPLPLSDRSIDFLRALDTLRANSASVPTPAVHATFSCLPTLFVLKEKIIQVLDSV